MPVAYDRISFWGRCIGILESLEVVVIKISDLIFFTNQAQPEFGGLPFGRRQVRTRVRGIHDVGGERQQMPTFCISADQFVPFRAAGPACYGPAAPSDVTPETVAKRAGRHWTGSSKCEYIA